MDLSFSRHLKELPDLSNATNLEMLILHGCESLVEFPYSCSHLHKLRSLRLSFCINLEVIHANMNLKSLEWVEMTGCSKLTSIPVMSKTIKYLFISGCTKLTSLPKLSGTLEHLAAYDCSSLETILSTSLTMSFANCYKLKRQSRALLQQSCDYQSVILPGREIPAEFVYRSKGNILTIPSSRFTMLKFCLVVSPNLQILPHLPYRRIGYTTISCRRIVDVYVDDGADFKFKIFLDLSKFREEHLVMFNIYVKHLHSAGAKRFSTVEFSSEEHHFTVIECGVQTFYGKSILENYESGVDQVLEQDIEVEDENVDCWTWLFCCFDHLSNITKKIGSLSWGKKRIEVEDVPILQLM